MYAEIENLHSRQLHILQIPNNILPISHCYLMKFKPHLWHLFPW